MIKQSGNSKSRRRYGLPSKALKIGWVFTLFLVLTSSAFAAEICVTGWDGPTGLVAAFQAIADEAPSIDIKLVQGTYTYNNAVGHRIPYSSGSNAISIRGGYVAGCAESQRVIDASNTVLDGAFQPQSALSLYARSIIVEGLTIKGMAGGEFPGPPVELQYRDSGSGAASIRVSRSRILGLGQAHDSDAPAAVSVDIRDWAMDDPALIEFSDNVVADNAGLIALHFGRESVLGIYNNTFAHNGGTYVSSADWAGGGADAIVSVANNVFWNSSSGTDLNLAGADYQANVTVNHNDIGLLAPSSVGAYSKNMTSDPKFKDPNNGNVALRDYHLTHASSTPSPGDSPAINAGTALLLYPPPATDVANQNRLVGSALDLGAYESSVDDEHNFLVTKSTDSASAGVGTLRWALQQARGNGRSTITFALPCGTTIFLDPNTALPDIDSDVVVDATSNSGWHANTDTQGFNATLCVHLSGLAAGQKKVPYAFRTVSSGRLTAKGFILSDFAVAAVLLEGDDESILEGNSMTGNKSGIFVAPTSGSVRIGPAINVANPEHARNIINGNTNYAIVLQNQTGGNLVNGNLLGLLGDGSTGVPVGKGLILVDGSPSNSIRSNTISGSPGAGVTIQGIRSTLNMIQDNLLGYPENSAAGSSDLSNKGDAAIVVTAGASNNYVGATLFGSDGGNQILSDSEGVWIDETGGVGNRVLGNSIVVGANALAIDIDQKGPTDNTAPGGNDTANHRMSYPVVQAFRTKDYEWILVDLQAVAGQAYRLDWYVWPKSGVLNRGIPGLFLGRGLSPVAGLSGRARYWIRLPTIPSLLQLDNSIPALNVSATATATVSDGVVQPGDTSEIGISADESFDMIYRDDLEDDPHGFIVVI